MSSRARPPSGARRLLARRANSVLLLIAIGLGIFLLVRQLRSADPERPAPVAPPPAPQHTLPASADLYVSAEQTAPGEREVLRIDGAPVTISLIQFDLRKLSTATTDAKLRLFALNGSRAGFVVRVVHVGPLDLAKASLDDARTAVLPGASFSGPFLANAWATADVTPLVNATIGKLVTLAVSTSAPTNIPIRSIEGGQNGPELGFRTKEAVPAPTPGTQSALVFAVGDIASCDTDADAATAALIQDPSATVLTLGDTAYERGSPEDFRRCYEPEWGVFKSRTRPAVGNHEYLTPGARGYSAYFGEAAGDPSRLYYSFDLGAWHVVSLNSNCSQAGGCGEGSPQEQWLRDDLRSHPRPCTLAFWHHPRFSSGQHGSTPSMQPLWRALHEAGADLVLTGHDHDYERFAPLNANGQRDDAQGIRQFVVGTGGKSRRPFKRILPNSEARSSDVFGVLRLALQPGGYEWAFLSAGGAAFTDSGSGACR